MVTQLLKDIRETKVDVDFVALGCLKERSLPVPDKHKQAAAFMQPLIDLLLKEIKSHVPLVAASSSADAEELIRAKAKLAQAGIALTPRKTVAEPRAASQESGSPDTPENTTDLPIDSKRGKKRKADAEDPSSQVKKLLGGAITSLKENRPKSKSTEHVEAWMQSIKQQCKGKFRELNKHVNFVVKLRTENADKSEMVEAATRFGLDRNSATRLSITNLSKCMPLDSQCKWRRQTRSMRSYEPICCMTFVS